MENTVNDTQPWLHEFEIAVDGPATALSDSLGDMHQPGSGWFVDDRRVLSLLRLSLGDTPLVRIASQSKGATTHSWAVARHLGDRTPDPTVDLRRTRTLAGTTLVEEVIVRSRATEVVAAVMGIELAGDGADLAQVKAGAADTRGVLPASISTAGVEWRDARHLTRVAFDSAPSRVDLTATGSAIASWKVTLEPGEEFRVRISANAARLQGSRFDALPGFEYRDFDEVRFSGDAALEQLIDVNLDDLAHLLMRDPESGSDLFAAAGTPWYLTMFGRDALWTARFMLPFSPALAEGTLRALARRQAENDDPARDAEPGKILHEVRGSRFTGGDLDLPTSYFGSVDSTPLWVILLHDARRWGLSLDVVRELLPNLLAAIGWMQRAAAVSPDGLLRYIDRTGGQGLANQGWKDSGDSMRRADGTIAPAPIALVEAQAYAVEAANGAAALYDELGIAGGDELRAWATDLAQRVRERFWTGGADSFLVMALDAEGRQVDGVGSNMGHTLGTGLLSSAEEERVVARLMRPDLLHELGIATLSSTNPAYNPIGYHTGSIWIHDTAIVMLGLVRAGYRDAADRVCAALLRAATSVQFRFPELLSGDALAGQAAPYPASCRPQAWSAASAAAMVTALVGVTPTAAGVQSAPSPTLPKAWKLEGVRRGDERLTLSAAGVSRSAVPVPDSHAGAPQAAPPASRR